MLALRKEVQVMLKLALQAFEAFEVSVVIQVFEVLLWEVLV